MNKFFKLAAVTILSSIAIFATTAHAEDNFRIKEGNYIGTLISEKEGVQARAYAQIVIKKDGTGAFSLTSLNSSCYKGELKLSQKRDPSNQLIFEVISNNTKEECPNMYYIVKKTQGVFTTHSAAKDPKGNYVSVSDKFGRWTKD